METRSIMVEIVGRSEFEIDKLIEAGLEAMASTINPGEFDAGFRARSLDELDHLDSNGCWDLDNGEGLWDDRFSWDLG